MRLATSALLAVLLLAGPGWAQPPDRCAAREVLLPQIDGWVPAPMGGLPPGREGCLLVRFVDEETVAGLITLRATPYETPGIGDEPQPQLLVELVGYLEQMSISVDEPKWRRTDVPTRGMEGFGNFTMFGFDGEAIGSGERSDVLMLFFDGPLSYFDVMLLTEPESVSADDFETNLRAYREVLGLLNTPAPSE